MLLGNRRRFVRYEIAGSVILPEIPRLFVCTMRDISLGGVYLSIEDRKVLDRLDLGETCPVIVQGICRLSGRLIRKDPAGFALSFWDGAMVTSEVREHLARALARELRSIYDGWAEGRGPDPARLRAAGVGPEDVWPASMKPWFGGQK